MSYSVSNRETIKAVKQAGDVFLDRMLASMDERLEETVILISNLHIPLALTLHISTRNWGLSHLILDLKDSKYLGTTAVHRFYTVSIHGYINPDLRNNAVFFISRLRGKETYP